MVAVKTGFVADDDDDDFASSSSSSFLAERALGFDFGAPADASSSSSSSSSDASRAMSFNAESQVVTLGLRFAGGVIVASVSTCAASVAASRTSSTAHRARRSPSFASSDARPRGRVRRRAGRAMKAKESKKNVNHTAPRRRKK